MDEVTVFIWRGVERLFIVGFGGVSIVLGYKLFLKIPEIRDSAGEVAFPGGASVMLSRVGPGVFFALFGASVLGFALHVQATSTGLPRVVENLEVPAPVVEAPAPVDSTVLSYSTGVETVADIEDHRTERGMAIGDVRVLIELQEAVAGADGEAITLPPSLVHRVDGTINRAKRVVMLSVWDDRWGDYHEFASWLNGGALEPAPESVDAAAGVYHRGEMPLPDRGG